MKKALLFLLALGMISCVESRPRLYPNSKYQRTDYYAQERAIDECMALADQYVPKKNMALEAAKQGAVGAGLGAATGAVGGAVFGKAGRGTGAGAESEQSRLLYWRGMLSRNSSRKHRPTHRHPLSA